LLLLTENETHCIAMTDMHRRSELSIDHPDHLVTILSSLQNANLQGNPRELQGQRSRHPSENALKTMHCSNLSLQAEQGGYCIIAGENRTEWRAEQGRPHPIGGFDFTCVWVQGGGRSRVSLFQARSAIYIDVDPSTKITRL
jgi:hypothetical protein